MNDNAKSVLPYYISGPYADATYSVCETATGRVLRKFRGPADLLQAQQYDSGEARGVESRRMVVLDEDEPPPAATDTLCAELQMQCTKWGVYWRAPDAHGVELTIAQATELLVNALGVEVEIKSGKNEFVECAANGSQGCSIKPCGPKGALQCEFCGAPPGQAGAVREQAREMNAGHVKRLADVMATTFAAREIPTGALYRGIAESQYHRSRETLFNAIDALAAMG